MGDLLHAELTYYLRGIGFQIFNELRSGHEEKVYEDALAHVLDADGVPYLRQPVFRIDYCGQQVGEYRPDLMLASSALMLELKATPAITALHKAQVLSCMAVTRAELGMIMNFGAASMEFARLPNFLIARTPEPQAAESPPNLLYPELTQRIRSSALAVHFALGPGFLHQVYRRAMRIELGRQGMGHSYMKQLPITFRGTVLGNKETRLLLVEQKVLVATVALTEVTAAHREKLRWAMSVLNCKLGLIANFYPAALDVQFVRGT